MEDTILLGKGASVETASAETMRNELANVGERMEERHAFMTPEHHRVRYASVRELPRNSGNPLTPEDLAGFTELPLDRVQTILQELEEHLFFLVRNQAGAVNWAFPVTTDRTSHRLTFSTGERLFGA